jgi:hypothetical protein
MTDDSRRPPAQQDLIPIGVVHRPDGSMTLVVRRRDGTISFGPLTILPPPPAES